MLTDMCRKMPMTTWGKIGSSSTLSQWESGYGQLSSVQIERELFPDSPRHDFDSQGYLVMCGGSLTWERPGLPLTSCSAQLCQSAVGGSRGVGKGRVLRSPALGYRYFQRLFSASSMTHPTELLHPPEKWRWSLNSWDTPGKNLKSIPWP